MTPGGVAFMAGTVAGTLACLAGMFVERWHWVRRERREWHRGTFGTRS